MFDFNDLLQFTIETDPTRMVLTINWLIMVIVLLVFSLLWWLIKKKMQQKHFRFRSVQLILPMGISVGIERNEATLHIANRIYTELVTRKAALLFDPANDHVLQVYDSLYVLFQTIRKELKEIPGGYLRDYPDSQKLLELGISILNDGLRPHLTQHQARFRSWYNHAILEQPQLAPQALQQQYPNYEALVKDLQTANQQINEWANQLKKLLYNTSN